MNMNKLLSQKIYIQVACSLVFKLITTTDAAVTIDCLAELFWVKSKETQQMLLNHQLTGFNHLCALQKPSTILNCPIWIAGTSRSNASEDKTASRDLWWCSDGFGILICFWGTFWSSRWISRRSDFRQVVVYVARCPSFVVSLLPSILSAPEYQLLRNCLCSSTVSVLKHTYQSFFSS